jgi:O-antigen/teichoic acid export membrane protein
MIRSVERVRRLVSVSPPGFEQLREFLRRERSALTSVFVSNLLLGLAGIVSGFTLARTLQPAGRGVLGSIQALPTLVAGFVLLGLHEAVVYCGIARPVRRRTYLSAALAVSTVVAAAVSLFLMVAPFDPADRSWAHRIYVLFIVVSPLTQIPLYVLQAADRFVAWSVLRSTTTIAWLAIALITIALPETRSAYFVSMSYLAALFVLAPVFVWIGYHSTARGPRPNRDDVRQLLHFGLPVTLTAAPLLLNLRLDVVVVSAMFHGSRIGYYVAAVAWGALLTPAFSTLSTVALPVVARRRAHGEESQSRLIVLLSLALIGLVVAVSVPFTRLCFPLVFGESYRSAANLASLALIAAAVQGGREVVASTLRGKGEVRLPLLAELAGLVVTLITLWLFLDRFGLSGGQWSSLMSYSTTLVVLLIAVAIRTRHPRPTTTSNASDSTMAAPLVPGHPE